MARAAGLRLVVVWVVGASAVPGFGADDENMLRRGRELFGKGAVPACAVCHTLKDAGAEGAVGPDPTRQPLAAAGTALIPD